MSHESCPNCSSSDGFKRYEDGGYCFSCRYKEFPDTSKVPEEVALHEINQSKHTKEYLPWRGLTKETLQRYGAATLIDPTGARKGVEIPFGTKAKSIARFTPDQTGPKYLFEGSPDHELGGSNVFAAGSARAVTLCEGGVDAFSAYQLLGSQYPVYYVRSASTAEKECRKAFDQLNSFERIYICFDNDTAGHNATQAVAKLFDFNKVYNVKLDKHNDVNEFLTSGDGDKFVKIWWNAKRFIPEGFISSFSEIKDLLETRSPEPLATYPWPTIQKATYGIFPAQLILVKAPTKIGKTEFISQIEDHILQTTDHNIGIIHIEDTKDRVVKRFASYEIGRPVHLPDSFAPNEDILNAYIKRTKRDNRVHIYSHFGSKDPSIIVDAIRYLITVAQCRIVFLDHVSMVVSGLQEDDERKVLDALGTNLATMVNDLDAALVCVSHVNDNGRTRGSRIFEQVAHTILSLQRDSKSIDAQERNTTFVTLEGNRIGSVTGPVGGLVFDPSTWRITESKDWEKNYLKLQEKAF